MKAKRTIPTLVLLLLMVLILPTLACGGGGAVTIPTNHLEMVIHASEPPGTYEYGDTINMTFSDNDFVLHDWTGSYEGTYTYSAVEDGHRLALEFHEPYPDFIITLYPDGTFTTSEYDPELDLYYHDTGTYAWLKMQTDALLTVCLLVAFTRGHA